jgi:hypothetical protein
MWVGPETAGTCALKFNPRDAVIAVLARAGVYCPGFIQTAHIQGTTNAADAAQAWLYNQYEINKLKLCVDNHVSPCDIDSGAPQPLHPAR